MPRVCVQKEDWRSTNGPPLSSFPHLHLSSGAFLSPMGRAQESTIRNSGVTRAMLGTPPAALMVPLLFSERETEKSGCVFPDSFCCKRADIPSGGHLFPCNMACVCASKKECTGCACGNSQLSSCLRLQLASYVTPQKGVEVRVSSSAIQDKNRAALACGGACGTLPPIFPWACAFDFFSSTGHLAPVLHEV